MTNTKRLLELARKKCTPATWYRLGKVTGIAQPTLGRCKNHGGTLDLEGSFRLADFLGLKRAAVAALIELDRAKPQKKKWWKERVRVYQSEAALFQPHIADMLGARSGAVRRRGRRG